MAAYNDMQASPVDDDLRIIVTAECVIDDALGEDSTCHIVAKNYAGEEVCKAELHFHNGDGCEGEEGLIDATDDTVYDSSELDDFKDELFSAIDDLNPYPAKEDAYVYENKGEASYTAGFPCEQCGEYAYLLMKNCIRWASVAIVDMNMNWWIVTGAESLLAKML